MKWKINFGQGPKDPTIHEADILSPAGDD